MLHNYVLVITGCISPQSDVPFLAVKDPNNRRQQYLDSIKFYIKHSYAKNIVYCDNSNSNVDFENVR